MSNQETLEKAIQKAIDGGWNYKQWLIDNERKRYIEHPEELWEHMHESVLLPQLIFNHDFAKAIWGEEPRTLAVDDWGRLPDYKLHLMVMVVAEDPIKYLGKNI